jgi:peptidoglycan/LPS O-acetylase OafA/YrhL
MINRGTWQYDRHHNRFGVARLILASAVIVSHSAELVDGNRGREPLTRLFHTVSLGELSVALFFLISGHLIAQSWDSAPSIPKFLEKRARRIYPGYVVAWMISVFVAGWLGCRSAGYFHQFRPFEVLGSLLKLHGPEVKGAFVGTPIPSVNSSMWTIQTEFRCYLLVPALGCCFFQRRRWVVLLLLAGTILLAENRGILRASTPLARSLLIGQPDVMNNYLVYFVSGICFYLYRAEIHYDFRAAGVSGIIAVLSLYHGYAYPIALPTFGAYTFFAGIYHPGQGGGCLAKLPDISYGIYLYGFPLQKLILWYWGHLGPWTLSALALPIAAGCGWLSWKWVERPFWKGRGAPRSIPPAGAETSPVKHQPAT